MASAPDLPANGTSFSPDGGASMNSSGGAGPVDNGTLPYLYHHPHDHSSFHGSSAGGINLVGALVGILLPHLVCTLFVAARSWSRGVLLRKWFVDDSLVVAAWACSTAVCVVYSMASIRSAHSHGGHHSYNNNGGRSQHALTTYLLRTYLGLIFYQLCLCLTKLSILALYLRVFAAVSASVAPRFPPPEQVVVSSSNRDSHVSAVSAGTARSRIRRMDLRRRLAWLTVAAIAAYGVPLLWMSIMQCSPAGVIDSATSNATASAATHTLFGRPVAVCFSFTPLLVASASLHTATDAWLIVLIVPFVLTRLRFLPRGQRWALAAVLSLSVFVIAASLTRLQLSLHANYRPAPPGSSDGMKAAADGGGSSRSSSSREQLGPPRANMLGFFIMTVLECDIALICASAPTLRPLLARLAPRLGLGEGAADDGDAFDPGRRHSSWRRSLFRRSRAVFPGAHGRHDNSSVDLTSVVSYHGYPWTGNNTPMRNRSKLEVRQGDGTHENDAGVLQRPPPVHDSSSSTSHLPLQEGKAAAARTVNDKAASPPPDDLPTPDGMLTRRPSSLMLFDNSYYDQYFGGSSPQSTSTPTAPRGNGTGTKQAGVPGAGIGLGILLLPRNGSQESFVMGLNDPASPTRLTRLTGVSGYSGETFTGEEEEDEDKGDKSKKDYGSQEHIAAQSHKPTETSFLEDDTDGTDTEDAGADESHDKTTKGHSP